MRMSSEVQVLLTEFRHNLELFYQRVHLVPPYDTVEKAVACFARQIGQQTADERLQMHNDETAKWRLYQEAAVESGFYKKHRGIITVGLLRSQSPDTLSKAQRYLQEPFL